MTESRLNILNGIVSTVGQPPYRITPSLDAAEQFLSLPPMVEPEDNRQSIVKLLTQLNPLDLRKLLTVIATDDKLNNTLNRLKLLYCGIAYPGAVSWPVPKPDEILEELKIDLGPVRGIVCTIDGQRLIAVDHRSVPKLLTTVEFQVLYGRAVEAVLSDAARSSAKDLRKFAAICSSAPTVYEVSLIGNDFNAVTKIVYAYTRDQLESYAKRNRQTITDVNPQP